MNIEPYKSIDVLQLGESTKDDCIAKFGEPANICTNREGVEEFHYADFILRFDPAKHVLRECTLLPCTPATIVGIDVTWDQAFLRQACERDGSPKDVYGFIVLAKLGITVTGIHDNDDSQLAITVFSKGAFDDLLEESEPFESSVLDRKKGRDRKRGRRK